VTALLQHAREKLLNVCAKWCRDAREKVDVRTEGRIAFRGNQGSTGRPG